MLPILANTYITIVSNTAKFYSCMSSSVMVKTRDTLKRATKEESICYKGQIEA